MQRRLPEEFDECWDAAGLEDGEEALPVVGEVVEGAGRALGRLQVRGVVHGTHQGSHHLK